MLLPFAKHTQRFNHIETQRLTHTRTQRLTETCTQRLMGICTQRLDDTRTERLVHTLTLTRTLAVKVEDVKNVKFLGHCGALWSSFCMERAISTCGPWQVDEFSQ